METVLQRIKRAKLTIKPSKCKFAQQNVKFLGHIVGQGFRTPSEIKVQAVLEFPTPRTKTQIRAFLGLAGYYQKYINLFSVIAAALTDALKGKAKKGEIKWTTECENAFRELKGKLIDKPVLYAPNFEREFIVQTDASNAGMGAVLTQLTEQGEEYPILYLTKESRTFPQSSNLTTLINTNAVASRRLINNNFKYSIPALNSNRRIASIITRLKRKPVKGMKTSTDGNRSKTNHCPSCPNVQLSSQHILSCPEIQARLIKISTDDLEDLIFSDKAVEVAEAVFDSFKAI
ncbi:retrovirus-related Pol polyprotein from transposon 297 [Trichonephila clavipes]|nr:retrovirus-related Pol polyprotein from transposon 297 [Trichonephila clavipes]